MPEAWKVLYAKSALRFIEENVWSERVLRKIFDCRELLESMPDLGRPYDPAYPAARPPFPCREIVIPDTPFSLHYIKQEETRQIVILCLEFQRVDPNARFSSINWGGLVTSFLPGNLGTSSLLRESAPFRADLQGIFEDVALACGGDGFPLY